MNTTNTNTTLPTPAQLRAAIDCFVADAQAMIAAYYATNHPTMRVPTLAAHVAPGQLTGRAAGGRRYVRVVRTHYHDRMAYCFIDTRTGAVLPPRGWNGPKKGGVPGNVFNTDHGLSAVDVYGPAGD